MSREVVEAVIKTNP